MERSVHMFTMQFAFVWWWKKALTLLPWSQHWHKTIVQKENLGTFDIVPDHVCVEKSKPFSIVLTLNTSASDDKYSNKQKVKMQNPCKLKTIQARLCRSNEQRSKGTRSGMQPQLPKEIAIWRTDGKIDVISKLEKRALTFPSYRHCSFATLSAHSLQTCLKWNKQ